MGTASSLSSSIDVNLNILCFIFCPWSEDAAWLASSFCPASLAALQNELYLLSCRSFCRRTSGIECLNESPFFGNFLTSRFCSLSLFSSGCSWKAPNVYFLLCSLVFGVYMTFLSYFNDGFIFTFVLSWNLDCFFDLYYSCIFSLRLIMNYICSNSDIPSILSVSASTTFKTTD